MKHLTYILVISMIIYSCQKSELESPVEGKADYTAGIEAFAPQVKTAMDSENQVVWLSGDRISIFHGGSYADEYELIEDNAGTRTGAFQYVSGDNMGDDVRFPCNVAFYPYTEGLYLSENTSQTYTLATVTLPEVQNYIENSFANGAFPMVAVTKNLDDHNLEFRNLLGVIKLQFKGTQIVKSVKVHGAGEERLSGAATVTAYADNRAPVINMAEDASTDVVLDCGDGVQLRDDVATNFYIALPPVIFESGFTVTVTDADEKQHTVSATVSNTVIRSSILVMPELDMSTDMDLFLNKSSLIMMPETSYQLVANIDGSYVSWTSSDNTVASVNAAGVVTANGNGNATIIASASAGRKAYCSVGVKSPVEFAPSDFRDYIDEDGVNHGKGIPVANVIWAPVNCGYKKAEGDYKGYQYGKLYQWGRKYGQGYDSEDASYPSSDKNFFLGPVYRSGNYEDCYIYGSRNWSDRSGDNWAHGEKTDYDPCPPGWRVSTVIELAALSENYTWMTENGQNGVCFTGEYTYCKDVPQVFFPAAGLRSYYDGKSSGRGYNGHYWSSCPGDATHYYGSESGAHCLDFNAEKALTNGDARANGFSVRCVQEDELIVPVSRISINTSSLELCVGGVAGLDAQIYPEDATDQNMIWISDNPSVAAVDKNGTVTAVSEGEALITVSCGMRYNTCKVSVSAPPVLMDYIDEYGINNGKGTIVGATVWAPVNCGYHAADYQWGKLYQWGRKYGQGYDGDATVPELLERCVSAEEGNQSSNANIFYCSDDDCWLDRGDYELWNSSWDTSPVKTDYDPCPKGWRVPTELELSELWQNHSSWTINESGQPGYWFCGVSSYSEEVAQVFLSAAGYRGSSAGSAYGRGERGHYWSSKAYARYSAHAGYFSKYYPGAGEQNYGYAEGKSVRCVQE